MYENIWLDYKAKYESLPQAMKLKEEEAKLAKSEAVLADLIQHKQILQNKLQAAKGLLH